jgi:hypothetical protein
MPRLLGGIGHLLEHRRSTPHPRAIGLGSPSIDSIIRPRAFRID